MNNVISVYVKNYFIKFDKCIKIMNNEWLYCNDCMWLYVMYYVSENDEEFERLLLHTEIRWLSKGACLQRLFNLRLSVIEFLQSINEELSSKLPNVLCDVAYLGDIYDKMNHLNLQLQKVPTTT